MAVTNAFAVAAELAEAAAITDAAEAAGRKAVDGITNEWMAGVPTSPGGYQGSGFTSSPGANKSEVREDAGTVTAEAYNQSFVAWFLQGGTAHHGPKYDFIGAAESHINQWLKDLGDEVGLDD